MCEEHKLKKKCEEIKTETQLTGVLYEFVCAYDLFSYEKIIIGCNKFTKI